MNGIELVSRARENPRLAGLPIIILSYKDAGGRRAAWKPARIFISPRVRSTMVAFLQAVVDLVGEASLMPPGDPA